MTADEVRDELLVEVLLLIDFVENAFEVVEELEGRFSHKAEHTVGSVFGCNLQASTHMLHNQFAGVFSIGSVYLFVASIVQQQIVAHTATNKTLLYVRKGIYRTIDVEQSTMVSVQIPAHIRMNARRAFALVADVEVLAMHGIHVGTRSSQITQIPLEIRHLNDGIHFFQNTFLAA